MSRVGVYPEKKVGHYISHSFMFEYCEGNSLAYLDFKVFFSITNKIPTAMEKTPKANVKYAMKGFRVPKIEVVENIRVFSPVQSSGWYPVVS